MRIRTLAKELAYNILNVSGFAKVRRARLAGGVVILTYHSFSESSYGISGDSIPAARFASQLRHLKKHYDVVGLREALKWLGDHETSDRPPRRRPAVVVSIDDGFSDNFSTMWPVVDALKVPVTVFLATDFLDSGRTPWPTLLNAIIRATEAEQMSYPFSASLRTPEERAAVAAHLKATWRKLGAHERLAALEKLRRHVGANNVKTIPPLTWGEVHEMRRNGVTFGSHTVYHGLLPHIAPAEAASELVDSKTRIEKELQEPCDWLAYPNGDFDQGVIGLARQAGYRAALTQERGVNRPGSEVMALRRIQVPHDESLGCFACRASLSAI